MMTYEEIVAKARKLAAEGNIEAAKRAMAMAEQMKGQTPQGEQPAPEPVDGATPDEYFIDPRTGAMVSRAMLGRNMEMGPGRAAVTGGLQGSALGGADEVMAGVAALDPTMGGTMAERAKFAQEYTRAANERARDDNKLAYYGGMIPAAAATTLGGWGAAGVAPRGATATGTLGRGIGMGAAEGAVVGALEGEGGMGRAVNSLLGMGLGAATGGAAVPAAWMVQKAGTGIGNMLSGPVEAMMGRGNAGKAGRAMAETLRRAGKTPDEIAQAVAAATREGQPEFRIMDALGQPGQRRASGIVRAGGDGADELAQFLRQRAVDAPDRMAGFADDAFPARAVSDMAKQWTDAASIPAPAQSAVTAEDAVKALREARGGVAGVTYDAARRGAGPVDVRGAVAAIDDRIGGMQGVDIKGDSIDARLAGFRNRLMSRNPAAAKTGAAAPVPGGVDPTPTSVELSDFSRVLGVKQDVEDAISAAVKAGRNNEARELGRLKSALDAALEQSSDGYRFANDTFAKMSRPIDAVGEGSRMASRAGRLEDTVGRFRAMSPEEQVAARAGYGDRIIQEIQGTASEAPDVSRRFASSKRRAEADAMALDPGLLTRRVDREREMARTFQRALGGSRTADNLSDVQDLSALADAGRAMRDLSVGNVPGAVSGVSGMLGKYVGPAMTGQTDATRKLIADALMSNNIEQALAAATRASNSDATKRAIIAAMLRRSNYPEYAQ